MEYLILFISYIIIPYVILTVIFPKEALYLMSPGAGTILPVLSIGFLIWLVTILINMIRAIRVCPYNPNGERAWGLASGLTLGLMAAIVGVVGLVVLKYLPILEKPFISITQLPNPELIAKCFYSAIGATTGYWMSRTIVSLC